MRTRSACCMALREIACKSLQGGNHASPTISFFVNSEPFVIPAARSRLRLRKVRGGRFNQSVQHHLVSFKMADFTFGREVVWHEWDVRG